MKASTLIEGLQIITKHEPEAEVHAEHDQIYVGQYKPKKMTAAERKTLDNLGFFECDESWSVFT